MSLRPKKMNPSKEKAQKKKHGQIVVKRHLRDIAKLKLFLDWQVMTDKPWTEEKQSYARGVHELLIAPINFPEYIDIEPSSVRYIAERGMSEEEIKTYAKDRRLDESWIQYQKAKGDVVNWLIGKTDVFPACNTELIDVFEKEYIKHNWGGMPLERAMTYGRIRGVEQ